MGDASLGPVRRLWFAGSSFVVTDSHRHIYSAVVIARPFAAWKPKRGLAETLAAIENKNEAINAFVNVADQDALHQQAAESAERLRQGTPKSPIDGVPVGIKDNVDTKDMVTAYGSGLFADRQPVRDAPVVSRLRQAGALIVGKTNLTELACGTEGRNERFGDVTNPVAPDRYSGGSSSGSAAAIASGMVPLAVGTDTSCSIRNPAASCGVIGLKPTFGRVSTVGVSVCSTRLDHVGPMSRTCDQAAALLSVMQDPGWPDPLVECGLPLPSLRIGLLGGPFIDGCEPSVLRSLEAAARVLGDLGHRLTEVEFDVDLAETDHHANVLCRDMFELYGSEVAAAPAGLVGAEVMQWFDLYRKQSDSAYKAALAFQRETGRRVTRLFDEVDVLVCATMRSGPALVNGTDGDRSDRAENCSIWDMSGHPSLNVPGQTDIDSPPLGVLLNGRSGADGLLLGLGRAIEHRSTRLRSNNPDQSVS